MVLSVDASKLPEMVDAVLRRARSDEQFRTKVRTDAERVLKAKEKVGLLDCG